MYLFVKSNRWKLFGSIILVLCIIGWFGFSFIFKDNCVNTNRLETSVSITSEQLLASFRNDETEASSVFVEKIIEVRGEIRDISYLNNRYTIYLYGGDEINSLICDMNPDQIDQVKALKTGQTVVLKGVCKGFLMDAIFLNCVILSTESNE